MKFLRTSALMLLTAACSIVAYRYAESHGWLTNFSESDTGNGIRSIPPKSRKVHAIGRLRPAGGVITIAAAPGERLESLNVAAGKPVVADEALGKLASYDLLSRKVVLLEKQRDAAVDQQKAEKAVAEAKAKQATLALEQALEQKNEELQVQQQQVELLEEKFKLAKSQAEHLRQLHEDDPQLVAAVEVRRQELLMNNAELEWRHAKLAFELAPRKADQAIEVARANESAAKALVDQLKQATQREAMEAEIDVAKEQLLASELRSPSAGTVLGVYTNKGEFITQRPILRIADLSKMLCVAEVYESQVKRIEEDQLVTIKSAAFEEPFDEKGLDGQVKRIGQMVTSPGLANSNPLAPSAKHIVEVEIEILTTNVDLDDEKEVKAFEESSRLVDLQVTVEFGAKKSESETDD